MEPPLQDDERSNGLEFGRTGVERQIPVELLLLDIENPRLPDVQEDEQAAVRTMVKVQGEKIVTLATHLVEHGTNPASLPIVMPADREPGFYTVLDGNRRVTALKLLASPDLANSLLPRNIASRLGQLVARFEQNPIESLRCIVFPDRDQADEWIQLLHRGEHGGAGLVEWDGQVAAVYDERRRGRKSLELEVLKYVQANGELSALAHQRINQGKFPVSTLERFLKMPEFWAKLNVTKPSKSGGHLRKEEISASALQMLSELIDDFATKRKTVSDVKRKPARLEYIGQLGKVWTGTTQSDTEEPSNNTEDQEGEESRDVDEGHNPEEDGDGNTDQDGEEAKDTGESQSAQTSSGQSATDDASKNNGSDQATRPGSGRTSRPRPTLIPRNFSPKGRRQHKINNILKELKELEVDKFPNACAVLFRVLIELGTEFYLEQRKNWPAQQLENSKLQHKLYAVIDDMQNSSLMTEKQLLAARAAAGGQTILVSSVTTLHGYVHNSYFSANPTELRNSWDNLQPFLEKLLSVP